MRYLILTASKPQPKLPTWAPVSEQCNTLGVAGTGPFLLV